MTIHHSGNIGSTGRLLKYQSQDIWIPSLEIDTHTHTDERAFYIFAEALTSEEYRVISKDTGKFEYLGIRDTAPMIKIPNQNKVFLDRLDYFLAVKYGPEPTLVVSKEWFRNLILQHRNYYHFEMIIDYGVPKLYGGQVIEDDYSRHYIKYHGFLVTVVESHKLPDKIQAMNTLMGVIKGCKAWTIDNRLIDDYGN